MPTIERVRVEDIHPYVDEYGNEYLSRDYSTKENQEYVAELARSMAAKGEPDEPVTLVRDGGIYRIVAGNSRVRAMRLLGTEECDAVLLDEDSAKAAVETCVRTNVKKKYSGVEESRFVQQLALFGGDEYVAENACIPVEKAARVRRAMEIVDDAAEDMTLDHLAAIVEFEGDGEAVARLEAAPESKWQAVYAELCRERERAKRREEMRKALEAAGVEVAGDADSVANPGEDLEYAGYLGYTDPDKVFKAALARNAIAATINKYGDAYLYRPKVEGDDEDDSPRARLQREVDDAAAAMARADERRTEYLAKAVLNWCADGMELDSLKGTIRDWALDWYSRIFKAIAPNLKRFDPSPLDAMLWANEWPTAKYSLDAVVQGTVRSYQLDNLKRWVGIGASLAEAGYAPSVEEQGLCKRIEEACEGVDEDD